MINYLDIYKDYLLFERNLSKATITTYTSQIGYFLDYLNSNDLELKSINANNIRDYLLFCSKNGLEDTTIALIITVLKSFYKFLNKDRLIDNNPMISIEHIKPKKKLPSTLSLEEIDKILADITENDPISYRNKTIIEFLFSTGARISECCSLKLNQLNLSEGCVVLHGKGGKDRVAFLGDKAINYLYTYISNYRPLLLNDKISNYVFIGKKVEKMDRSVILKMIKKYAKISGINKVVSPHTLRHSFATCLLENDADLITVKTLLGHQNVATTQIYTHISKERLKNVYNKAHPFGGKENKDEI